MIKVLVADDHPVVLRGVRYILGDTSDMTVVGEVTNAQELLEAARTIACDALVTDLSMPGSNGLELLRDVKRERPDLPIIVLSMHSEDEFAIRALKAGASAFVTKGSAAENLIEAIRAATAGRKYITSALAERLVDQLAEHPTQPHDRLSKREFQVLRLIASGRTVSEIADELSLSVKTVSTYRARILEKMKLRTNAELTAYALRNRLVE
jgi:two-component system, NarL family, invasion response regulator UvrY